MRIFAGSISAVLWGLLFGACGDDVALQDGGPLDAMALDAWESPEEADRRVLETEMRAGGLPGLAVAVVGLEGVLWSATLGMQDVTAAVPVTEDTLFPLASVSKLVVGVMLMQAVEAETIRLSDAVGDYVSHGTAHPLHRDAVMDVRSLATHTSGMRDTLRLFVEGASEGDPVEELGEFTASYTDPAGELYSLENFGEAAPGESYAYCNFGFALLGHVLEGASGRDFRSMSNELLESLAIDGRFFFADVEHAHLAVPYSFRGGEFVSHDGAEIRYYPAGGMKGSLRDMTRLLRLFMGDGEIDGERVLSASSVALMEAVANPELNASRGVVMGGTTLEGVPMHGHGGAGFGGSADVWYGEDFGVIVLANSNAYVRNSFGDSSGAEAMAAIRAYVTRRGQALMGR